MAPDWHIPVSLGLVIGARWLPMPEGRGSTPAVLEVPPGFCGLSLLVLGLVAPISAQASETSRASAGQSPPPAKTESKFRRAESELCFTKVFFRQSAASGGQS